MVFPVRGADEGLSVPAADICKRVIGALGQIFGICFDAQDTFQVGACVKRAKEFCVGLLENPVNHTWWSNLSRLGKRERISISGSLFLLRKVLPAPPDPRQVEKHATLMSEPAPSAPPGYANFCSQEIDRMFPVGWDRAYASHVFSHTTTSSSSLECGRQAGGAREWVARNGRDWFEDQCLGDCERPQSYSVRYAVVNTGGKNRGVTIPSGYSHVLGPLHRTLYDFLSQKDWLMRGEARGKKFSSFQKKEGEIFVSGDYESATDNLSLPMAEHILSRVFSRARHIPQSMRSYALRSLRAEISYPGGRVVTQKRGQLMGNYLSFPLLCLQNYLAFRSLIPRDVPVKINGDDIVFRSTRVEADRWAKGVGTRGLTLSRGKTLFDSSVFSLNSSFFWARRSRIPRDVPVLRASMLESRGALPSGGSFVKFTRNWTGSDRRIAGGLWLLSHRRSIDATGRSVEVLGIPADNSQLHTARLAVREAFFRGQIDLLRLPENLIPTPPQRGITRMPQGWVKATAFFATQHEVLRWRKEFASACHDLVWSPNRGLPSEDALQKWWEEVRKTGLSGSWYAWQGTVKRAARLLGGYPLNTVLRPPAKKKFRTSEWIPADELTVRRYLTPGLGLL